MRSHTTSGVTLHFPPFVQMYYAMIYVFGIYSVSICSGVYRDSIYRSASGCCSVLQCVAVCFIYMYGSTETQHIDLLQCDTVCCSVCFSVSHIYMDLQRLDIQIYCSGIQCVAVCVAVCFIYIQIYRDSLYSGIYRDSIYSRIHRDFMSRSSYIQSLCRLHYINHRVHPPNPMNHAKICKGWSPRHSPSELVPRWYKTFPPDHVGRVEIKKPTRLGNKRSTA